MKKILASLMALIFVFGLSSANLITTKAKVNENHTNYSGEELFKGLFLGQGEVAKRIPELPEKKEINTKEAKDFGNELTEMIKKKDEKYFDELKESVYANNPKKISNMLEKGANLITSVIPEMDGYNIKKKPNPDEATGQCVVWTLGVVVVYYAGAAVQVAGVAAYVLEAGVYLTTATVQTQYTASASDTDVNSLTKEVFVKSIVENL
ncbi:sporulation delaying protein family toxin [Bacillus changyiensis]|uniref:sporulation delaying protein family toxin n=1 Tax=Bacillus changyiensis TaxID=3004103 RepID=UPI0022E57A00|nr:sporulation delaying protein family toxin [Bacillus changyiensis]MDA1477340.1 sporulation delaying protein family toxin [Bacillus changyiensis]